MLTLDLPNGKFIHIKEPDDWMRFAYSTFSSTPGTYKRRISTRYPWHLMRDGDFFVVRTASQRTKARASLRHYLNHPKNKIAGQWSMSSARLPGNQGYVCALEEGEGHEWVRHTGADLARWLNYWFEAEKLGDEFPQYRVRLWPSRLGVAVVDKDGKAMWSNERRPSYVGKPQPVSSSRVPLPKYDWSNVKVGDVVTFASPEEAEVEGCNLTKQSRDPNSPLPATLAVDIFKNTVRVLHFKSGRKHYQPMPKPLPTKTTPRPQLTAPWSEDIGRRLSDDEWKEALREANKAKRELGGDMVEKYRDNGFITVNDENGKVLWMNDVASDYYRDEAKKYKEA